MVVSKIISLRDEYPSVDAALAASELDMQEQLGDRPFDPAFFREKAKNLFGRAIDRFPAFEHVFVVIGCDDLYLPNDALARVWVAMGPFRCWDDALRAANRHPDAAAIVGPVLVSNIETP